MYLFLYIQVRKNIDGSHFSLIHALEVILENNDFHEEINVYSGSSVQF